MATREHAPSYYAASANRQLEFPALADEQACDVCVVGGGFTGLSAALELAGRGYDVVLLEAGRIGSGASGRNGGQIVSGYNTDHRPLARRLGKDADRRLWDMAEEAKDLIRTRVARHEIACDLTWGYIHAANKSRHVTELEETARQWSDDYGYAGLQVLDAPAMAARTGTDRYVGGLFDPGSGHLHPLNYALGLAAAAGGAGVRMFEDSEVIRLITGPPATAATAGGLVRARHIVLAGNAYMASGINTNVVPSIGLVRTGGKFERPRNSTSSLNPNL